MTAARRVWPEPFIKIRRWLWKRFEALLNTDSSVLTCGRLVFETYPVVAELLKKENRDVSEPFPQPFQTPFGRNVYPFLFQSTYEQLIPQVEAFKERMGSRGLRVHRSDIRKELFQGSGRLSKESVATLLENASIQNAPPTLGDILADLEENLPGLIIQNSSQGACPGRQRPACVLVFRMASRPFRLSASACACGRASPAKYACPWLS